MEEEKVDIARRLFDATKYPLLPTRVMGPQQQTSQLGSFEYKKELLLAISPAIMHAERRRKEEEEEREQFTRCRVEKGDRRSESHFDYFDIDTSVQVSAHEYEKRYLIYLQRIRNSKSVPIDDSFGSTQRDSETSRSEMIDEFPDSELDRRPSARSRRGTLSPRSAKQMMLEVIDDEGSDGDGSGGSIVTSEVIECVETEEELTKPIESTISKVFDSSDLVAVTVDELLKSPVLTKKEELFEQVLDLPSLPRDDTHNDVPQLSPTLPLDNLAPSDPEVGLDGEINVKINTEQNKIAGGLSEQDNFAIELSSAQVEERARERYMFRMQQAELKYLWEIASWEAASLAVKFSNQR